MISHYSEQVLLKKWHDISNLSKLIISKTLMTSTKNWMQTTLSDISLLSDIELNDSIPGITTQADLKTKLTEIISHLMDHNFEKLLWILYRIDVDEEKAKSLLSKHLPADAPAVLAELIILRQLKKEELKKQFENIKAPTDKFDDDLRL